MQAMLDAEAATGTVLFHDDFDSSPLGVAMQRKKKRVRDPKEKKRAKKQRRQ